MWSKKHANSLPVGMSTNPDFLDMLSYITGVRIKLCPNLCMLGTIPIEYKLKINKKKSILLQAKHSIAISWRSTGRPSLQAWPSTLSNSLALEKLT